MEQAKKKGWRDEMNLVICGNGMDLHLGFKTSYQCYRDYLNTERFLDGKSAISVIENSSFFISREADCWSDLEKSLSFDCKKYIEGVLFAFDRDITPYNEKNSRDQMMAANKFLKESPSRIARSFTNDWFFSWIAKEYYSRVESIKSAYNGILNSLIGSADRFVTFNYTPTLEDVFGVNPKDILYIHDRFPQKPTLPFTYDDLLSAIIESGKKKFQFGSTDNKLEEWEGLFSKITMKSKGQLFDKDSTERELIDIYYSFSKDISSNYEALERFIKACDVDNVVILGHSFLGIDEPYYSDILVPLFREKNWRITWHGDENAARAFVSKYGLNHCELIGW